jgi:hypothetical protein
MYSLFEFSSTSFDNFRIASRALKSLEFYNQEFAFSYLSF